MTVDECTKLIVDPAGPSVIPLPCQSGFIDALTERLKKKEIYLNCVDDLSFKPSEGIRYWASLVARGVITNIINRPVK